MNLDSIVIGFSEAGRVKGETPARIFYLYYRGFMPKPIDMREKKPVWKLSDLVKWTPPLSQKRRKQ